MFAGRGSSWASCSKRSWRTGLYERTGALSGLAMRLLRRLEKKGWPLLHDSPTNQKFPIVPTRSWQSSRKILSFSDWARWTTHRAVRFCTS